MLRNERIRKFLITITCFLSGYASAADCRNLWQLPASQTMRTDAVISFSLNDYKNGERHFSVKDSGKSIDIYYLKGVMLVKGYSQAEIKKLPATSLFMMPMAFTVPTAVLAEAVPKGPCSVERKVSLAASLEGMRLKNWKLTQAVGELAPSALGEVSYQIDVSIDPPAPEKKSVHYAGTMSFLSQEESPNEETDVTGYLLVMGSQPFLVAGSAGVPTKLGDLRRFLAAVH